MLQNDVKYRNTIDPSTFPIELLLVFLEKPTICNYTNLAQNSVFQKNIDFLKNSRLNSRKIALKRRKLQKYNGTKHFFY